MGVIAAANASSADVIQIELESGFSEEDRASAVETTCRALAEMDWSDKEAWVRFRHIDAPDTRKELAQVVAARPHLVYCAKVKSAEDILRLDDAVSECEAASGIAPGATQIGAVVERIEALAAIGAIAASSPRMRAIMFGANDMSLDFGYRRSRHPRGQSRDPVHPQPDDPCSPFGENRRIDAAWTNRENLEESDADARFSAQMGFTGKTALTPEQVPGIHRAFRPTPRETAWAQGVLAAAAEEDPA